MNKQYQYNSKVVVGTGCIAVPMGVDRDEFVETCYRRERVCVIPDHGGTLVKNCYIDSQVLQQIKFPESYDKLGSQIAFVMDRFGYTPIVVACIAKKEERLISSEESFVIKKKIKNGSLSIVGDGSGKLLIDLYEVAGAKVSVNVKGEDSSIEVNSGGVITCNSIDDVTINSQKKIAHNVLNESGEIEKTIYLDKTGLTYRDDNGNSFEIDYLNNKIIHNKGNQPVPRGEDLKSELIKLKNKLDKFIDTFQSAITAPGDGGKAIQIEIATAMISTEDANFDNINSEKSFID